MTDAQGESLLILTVGFLLMLVARPAAVGSWIGFTLALFLSYQTRPASQSLIVLFPLLGLVLLGLVVSRGEWVRRRWRVGLGLAAAYLIPFLAWCTFRYAVVGHFGLVCFAGYQLCALTGNFISEDVVTDLPEDLRPYLEAVLVRRDQLSRGEVMALFGEWRPAYDSEGRLQPGIIEDDLLFCFVAHDLFFSVAAEMYADPVLREKRQMAMALALIKARPWYYWQWFVASMRSLPAKVIWSNKVLRFLGFCLVVAAILWHWAYIYRRVRSGPDAVALSGGLPYACLLNAMLVVGLGVAVCQGMLLALISSNSFGSRYCDRIGVFLVPMASLALAAVLRRVGELLGFLAPITDSSPKAGAKRQLAVPR